MPVVAGIAHLKKLASGRLVKIPDPNGHLGNCLDLDPDCILIPCQCWCCSPDAYKITISGGTGPNVGFNGTHILTGGSGVYSIVLVPGAITLTFTSPQTIECKNFTLTIGSVGSASGVVGVAQSPFNTPATNASNCNGSPTIGELSTFFCPVDPVVGLNPIEVTIAGIIPCPGCISGGEAFQKINEVNLISVNGTYSLGKTNCVWTFSEAVDRVSYNLFTLGDCIVPHPPTGASPEWTVQVSLIGSSPDFQIKVVAGGRTTDKVGYAVFQGTKDLDAGDVHCNSTSVSNLLVCGVSPGTPIGSGGTATINWNP